MKVWIAALLLSTAAIAQTPDPKLIFEVASARPAAPRPVVPYPNVGMIKGGPGTPDPGQIDYTNVPMREILQLAYGFQQTFQLSAPAWVQDTRFDIVAKVPAGATKDQFQVMLQNLLADRFDLTVHHESRDLLGYEMVIAQGGPNVKESADAPAGDPTVLKTEQDRDGLPQLAPGSAALAAFTMPNGSTRDSARQQPMSVLTWLLAKALGEPVVDKTGLTGKYDFNLTFVRDERTGANIVGPPDLFTAMQQQLGLRLDQKKIPMDVLVVDRAEKTPKEN